MSHPYKLFSMLALICSLLMLSGCATQHIKDTKHNAESVLKDTFAKNDALVSGPDTNLVQFSNTPFLGSKKRVAITEETVSYPHFLGEDITLNHAMDQDKTALDYLAILAKIIQQKITLSDNAKNFLFRKEAAPQATDNNSELQANQQNAPAKPPQKENIHLPTFPLQSKGTVHDLLDELTHKMDLYWHYDAAKKEIVIYRTETKQFRLNLLPGSVSDTSSIAGTGSSTQSKVEFKNDARNPWEEALKSIQSISKDLIIEANQTYGLVVVTGTPDELARVKTFVDQLNKTASSGVMIQLSVYDVRVSHTSNYGINWNAIYKATSNQLSWSNMDVTNALPSPYGTKIAKATLTGDIKHGPFDGSSLVASAIQKYTDSTYVTGDRFFSLNGQSNPISDVQQNSYIKQVSVTALGGNDAGSSDNVQVSAEPATLQTGYVFNITPQIVDDASIRIHLSLEISALVEMVERQMGGKDNPTTIQLPRVKHKKLIQSFALNNGQTAVISGFTSDVNNVGTQSLAGKRAWGLGGSQATEAEKIMTVIVVSAYIIGSDHA